MAQTGNTLFPIFLKLQQLRVLLVGAGPVGLEKLTAILQNSPDAQVQIIALDVLPEIKALIMGKPRVVLSQRAYEPGDMQGFDLAIIAVNNRQLSETIAHQARHAGILVNVADTPDLCDFYLGSIVQKGDLKIAISTNGKSPTMAKRMRQWLEATIPDNLTLLLDQLFAYRKTIKGNFEEKVAHLNDLTSVLLEKNNPTK